MRLLRYPTPIPGHDSSISAPLCITILCCYTVSRSDPGILAHYMRNSSESSFQIAQCSCHPNKLLLVLVTQQTKTTGSTHEKARVPKISIDNIRVKTEKVLRNTGQTGIFVTKRRHEDSRLAVVIEFKMDRALWQNSPLEQVQRCRHLCGEAVLKDETRMDIATLNDRQEFSCSIVDVRSILGSH